MSVTNVDKLYRQAEDASAGLYRAVDTNSVAAIATALTLYGVVTKADRVVAKNILDSAGLTREDDDYGTLLTDVATTVAKRKWYMPKIPTVLVLEQFPTVDLSNAARTRLAESEMGKNLGVVIEQARASVSSPYYEEARLFAFLRTCGLQRLSRASAGVIVADLRDSHGRVHEPVMGVPVILVRHVGSCTMLRGNKPIAVAGNPDTNAIGKRLDRGPRSFVECLRTQLWAY